MKAVYFTAAGQPVEQDFPLYVTADGDHLTTLMDKTLGRHIRHREYDAAVSGFAKLPAVFKDVYRQEMTTYLQTGAYPPAEPSAQYLAALKDAGIDRSAKSFAIISDHLHGGAARKEAVYSVGGRPVHETNMNPITVSFSMGQNMYVAARLRDMYADADPNRAAARIARETGVGLDTAKEWVASPLGQRLRAEASLR